MKYRTSRDEVSPYGNNCSRYSENRRYPGLVRALVSLGLLFLVFGPASANASMGPALQVFDSRAWVVYVVAMIVLEAWLIGRWMGHGWGSSLGRALLFNLVTTFCCTDVGGVAMKFVLVGSEVNPNPLGNAVALLVGFGLLSALIEGVLWTIRRPDLTVTEGKVLRRATEVHLLGAAVGLVILLVPERPYPALEGRTAQRRRWLLCPSIRPCLERDNAPKGKDLTAVLAECGNRAEPDAWTSGYRPVYGRFATGEDRQHPIGEWNPSIAGKPWEAVLSTWLFRYETSEGHAYGCTTDGGGIRIAVDPERLGF